MSDQAAWVTPNTKEAAALNALGFPIIKIEIVEQCIDDNLTGNSRLQISFGPTNAFNPGMSLKSIINPWKQGKLTVESPMHPFLIGLRACNAYDRIMQWIHQGTRYRLKTIAGDRCTIHVAGEEDAALRAWPVAETDDLRLACALSVIGFPCLDVIGTGHYKTFRLPQYGHPIKDAEGLWQTPDIAPLVARFPGKRDLLIEATQPLHPVLPAYNAGHVHAQLLTEIKAVQRRRSLVVSHAEHTSRFAIISEWATDKVLDNVQAHFRLPAA